MTITMRKLDSGYWLLRGCGPCNWAQPKHWPCDEMALRAAAFPEASEDFIRECLAMAVQDEAILQREQLKTARVEPPRDEDR